MAHANELTCKELVEIVTDYLEGKLSPADRARFEAHVTGCDGCTRYVQQMRMTIRLTGTLTEEKIAEPARTKLLSVFRDWKSGKQ